jgi:hypothetical protein
MPLRGAFDEPVTFDDFTRSLAADDPPAWLPPALLALWHDRRGDWDKAHQVAQTVDDAHGAWVHAYLHRKEGDLSNARYWYRRAGQPTATDDLEMEWQRIAAALLRQE